MPRQARFALGGAAAGVALLLITWYAAYHVGIFERVDQSIFDGFVDLHRPRVGGIASFIARLCNPSPYVYFAAVPVLVALLRGRVRVAITIGAILLGANITTELLKPALATSHGTSPPAGYPVLLPGSWPSGHATAAMSLALCSVLAAPARLRPVVAALGAAFAVAVSYSFLTLGWHYPSDVFGGFLVAGAWTAVGVAFLLFTRDTYRLRAVECDRIERLPVRSALRPAGMALLCALAAAGLLAAARPHAVGAFVRGHEVFVAGAAAIGALGLALATAVMLALRR